MIDAEVERLRRLRGSALRLRAVARALGRLSHTQNDQLLNRGACAAWRIARAVSGRLRAHPYAAFQRDASVRILFTNSLVAWVASLRSATRAQAVKEFEVHLRAVSRQLNDARALAWAADLSDTFGRSQNELRALSAITECELYGRCPVEPARAAAVSTHSWPYLTV